MRILPDLVVKSVPRRGFCSIGPVAMEHSKLFILFVRPFLYFLLGGDALSIRPLTLSSQTKHVSSMFDATCCIHSMLHFVSVVLSRLAIVTGSMLLRITW
jgi:hypothetical protein